MAARSSHVRPLLQDCGVRLGRVAEALRYVDARLGVTPLWTCPYLVREPVAAFAVSHVRRLAAEEARPSLARPPGAAAHAAQQQLPPLMMVDVGVYGEPVGAGAAFRHRRDVGALQRFVDSPAMWGMLYAPRAATEASYDCAAYERLREAYGAAGAFPHVLDKVAYTPPPGAAGGEDGEGPIFLWRLYRRGVRTQALVAVAAVAAVAVVGVAAAAGLIDVRAAACRVAAALRGAREACDAVVDAVLVEH